MSYENSFSISIPMDEGMCNLIKYIMKSIYMEKDSTKTIIDFIEMI